MKIIGLSTGTFYKFINPLSAQAVADCKNISHNAIEICCVKGIIEEAVSIDSLTAEHFIGFNFVSLHAPARNIIYDDNNQTHAILTTIQHACDRLPISHVVFHPDTIKDWKIFSHYTFTVAIENMDKLKSTGQTHSQLQKIFDQFDCRFVLDLNHCFTNDQSMQLADALLNSYTDRLCEVHVSGYVNYHEMLHITKQPNILHYLPKINVPIIIESVCEKLGEAQKEFDYINQYL